MARICSEDECVEHSLAYVRTNFNRRRICDGREERMENIAYRSRNILELLVLKATNVDELNGAFLPTRRKMRGLYSVIFSNQTGLEFKTRVTVGNLEPVWNQCFNMIVDEFNVFEFLNLELIDEKHGEDPRTSQGRVVVGRARIKLPKDFGVVETRRVELVKEAGFGIGNTVVGYIYLKLRLFRAHARNFACLP